MTRDVKNINSTKIIYSELVRPDLQYNSILWSPHYTTHVDRFEQLQHFSKWQIFHLGNHNIFL